MAAGMKTLFVCSQCGYESKKWLGKCPSCNEWNSFSEETVREKKAAPVAVAYEGQQAVALDEVARGDWKINAAAAGRLSTGPTGWLCALCVRRGIGTAGCHAGDPAFGAV